MKYVDAAATHNCSNSGRLHMQDVDIRFISMDMVIFSSYLSPAGFKESFDADI